ncbi:MULTISPECIES: MFS transporter [unclassified Novosphingobium]|uniref:MFS transporter n=1 Tax=unclassified Novosphingobium TaxID=2644732 RepID=UPI00180F3FED|nr:MULTISPECIES: MFS transporter [unclassified Novosphingobium]NMN05623.1 MFS family permease [Novosphingobium sp. SG919]NMN88017.1 MFS family permease [Novosphingobium sp. SG916]
MTETAPSLPKTGQPETGQPKTGGALAPFGYPAFRAIWTANLVSNLGSTIQAAAAAWLMTELTRSHVLIALVQASSTLPILLLGLLAGGIADNFDRRRVMIWAQSAMLVVSAVLAVLGYRGMLGPLSLLVLTLMVGMGTAINQPAWQASVRLQVGKADLPQAIALNAMSANLARSAGPALGGMMISILSVSAAFAANALSYIGMLVVLARWRPEARAPQRQPMLASIKVGVAFCAGSVPIRKVLLRGAMFGFGASAFQALMPAVAHDTLAGTELDYGLMLGSFGVGSIVNALWVTRARRRFGAEAIVSGATVVFLGALLLLAQATTLAAAIVAGFVAGSGWVAAMTSLNVAMQLRSPEAILGRCLSLYQAITFGSMALGAWAWGWIADQRGLAFALHAAAAWLALNLVLRLFVPMPAREEGRVDTVKEPVPSPRVKPA